MRNSQVKPMSARPRSLIINGDDFGISSEVNQAIIQAHTQGVLTSTSLMVTAAAAAEAIALAHQHPTLAVGLHLVLACGRSALPPSEIPHLVDADGNFSDQPNKTSLRYAFDRAAQQEIHREIRAQLEKFRQTGLPLSHVDGHVHIHVQPVVLRCLAELAEEFDIRFIRLPFEDLQPTLAIDGRDWLLKLVWWSVFGGLRRYGESILRAKGIRYSDRVYGVLASGNMTETYLLQLIPQITAERVEIYAHPALDAAAVPSAELAALLSDRVRTAIATSGFKLTQYTQLG